MVFLVNNEHGKTSLKVQTNGNLCLLHKIAREIMVFLVNNEHGKRSLKVQTNGILKVYMVLFVICTCVTTLHPCYMRIHLFSANQKLVIFTCTYLNTVIIQCKFSTCLHEGFWIKSFDFTSLVTDCRNNHALHF